MPLNDQIKKFSKQQLAVLVFSVVNTILAVACTIWVFVLFKEKKKSNLTSKVHLLILAASAILGQLVGLYGVLKENLWSTILFSVAVAFHLGADVVLGFEEHLFWLGSGVDLVGLLIVLVYAWELKGKYFMAYQRNGLGATSK